MSFTGTRFADVMSISTAAKAMARQGVAAESGKTAIAPGPVRVSCSKHPTEGANRWRRSPLGSESKSVADAAAMERRAMSLLLPLADDARRSAEEPLL